MENNNFWYAVQQDREDSDCGYGSFDLEEAKRMLEAYPHGLIAVIDQSGREPMCVDVIKYSEVFGGDEEDKDADYDIMFLGGCSRNGSYAVDLMWCVTRDGSELYAEIPVTDDDCDEDGNETNEAEDAHYAALKAEIESQAEELGIPAHHLTFPWG